MYSFILGFQRLVWCPKWTPASSNSFMVILANQPPHLVCIRRSPLGCPGLPFPSPHREVREELNTLKTVVRFWSLVVSQPPLPTSNDEGPTTESSACCTGTAFSRPSGRTSCVPCRVNRE